MLKSMCKFTVLTLLILSLCPMGLVFATDYDNGDAPIYSPDPSTPPPVLNPLVKLVSPNVVEVKGGAVEEITISLKNSGSGSAKSVVVQANIEATAPFTVEFVDKSNSIATIGQSGTRTAKLKIKVDKNAATGSYPITLKYNYRNENNENFSETDTIMVRVDNVSLGPDLRLYDFKASKETISSGDAFMLTATFENISTETAHDATVTIDGMDKDGIYLENSVDNAYIKTFAQGTKDTVAFNLRAASKAKKGTYALLFKVAYKDNSGEDHTKEYTYYVTVGSTSGADEDKGDVAIINVSAPTATFNVGSEFAVTMDIVNNGAAAAKNVKITAETDEGGAIVPKTANVRMIQRLEPGASEALEFRFSPTSKSKTQNYTIGFLVDYETGEENDDGTLEKISFSQYAGVNVSNPDNDDDEDKEKRSIPKIIVSAYEVNPQIVSAGQEFDLDMTFLNTHASKSIENIKISLIMEDKSTSSDTTEDKGNVFSPVNGSNTFYVDNIAPKGQTSEHLRLFCIPDASAKTYTVNVKFEYQDSEYNVYEEETLIGITVKQATRLETSDIAIQTNATVGNALPISFQLFNMGKVTLSNLMVSIDAPGFDTVSTESTVYFGKFNPSDSNYYDGMIVPTEGGQQPVKVVISYEDDSMEAHEVVREFTVTVEEMFFPEEGDWGGDDFGMMEMGQTSGGIFRNKFVWIGIGVGVVAIVGVGGFMVKKKKQKGMDFDE